MYHRDLGIKKDYIFGSIRSKRLAQFYALEKFPIFVETGTCLGDGVSWALGAGFSSMYSMEADRLLYGQCVSRFKDCTKVTLYHGLSSRCLADILDVVQGPLFIYLDAHWSGGSTSDSDPIPLIEETHALLNYKDIKKCIIVIDDERLMSGLVDPPSSWGGQIKLDLLSIWHSAGFTSTYLDDSIIFEGKHEKDNE